MDPISIAGIGLSVAGLAFQAFAGCVRGTVYPPYLIQANPTAAHAPAGYQLFAEAEGMPEEYQHLRVRLRIEQTRLLRWSEKVDLVEERLDEPSRVLLYNRNLIIDILLGIQAVFRDCVDIHKSYDHLVPVRPAEQLATGNKFEKRFPEETNNLLKKTLSFVQKAPQMPKRLKWAALKKQEFSGLVEKLIGYNDSIEGLLDSSAIEQLQVMQQQTYMAMLQLNSNVIELKQISQALQVPRHATESGDGQVLPAYTPRHSPTNRDGQASFARLADFKAEQLHVESQPSNLAPIKSAEIVIVASDNSRSEARYHDLHVWVEWKYDPHNNLNSEWNRTIKDRIKKLATLLGSQNKPEQFGAPQCLGYFDDKAKERYGLVYRKPDGVPPKTQPTSLLNLIQTSEMKPSLTKRIALAHAIARCLLFLHSVNWLHKGLRSENIIFFTPTGSTLKFDAPIIAGFEYARPDWSEEITDPPHQHSEHDIYRHPNMLREMSLRSRKSYDIYSLGIVLVEIAYWTPINELMEMPLAEKDAKSKVKKVRERLLTGGYLKFIEGHVGEVYATAVARCLAGGRELGINDDADEADREVGARMQAVFSEKVVDKLGEVKV